jgi:hypothetical protein
MFARWLPRGWGEAGDGWRAAGRGGMCRRGGKGCRLPAAARKVEGRAAENVDGSGQGPRNFLIIGAYYVSVALCIQELPGSG